MKNLNKVVGALILTTALGAGAMAATGPAARYDDAIQTKVSQKLEQKKQFANVRSSVEDGIITLTGTVDTLQQKLDAAKAVKKTQKAQGVRNLIMVASTAPDGQLTAQLDRKLYYDRIGYDNLFNFMSVSVTDGVATITGETFNDVGKDSALALVNNTPGVKDVIDEVKVSPTSIFDNRIRLGVLRAIYRDPVLSRYAIDPARPIRIIVDNGHVTLYGVVDSTMDKQVAGIRANGVFGAFSVKNDLQVAGKS